MCLILHLQEDVWIVLYIQNMLSNIVFSNQQLQKILVNCVSSCFEICLIKAVRLL